MNQSNVGLQPAWQGNIPSSVLTQPSKRVRGHVTPPRSTAWAPPQELINLINSINIQPFNFDLAPKSRMKHGIRIDIRPQPLCYLQLLESIKTLFNCTSVYPVPLKGYIDIGFKNEQLANNALNVPLEFSGFKLPLLRTRYNKGQTIVLCITRLPTSIEPSALKAALEQGLSNYGSCVMHYNKHPLLPDFVGFKAYAEITPAANIRKSDIPQHVYLSTNPEEPFYIHAEGSKFNQNLEPVLLGTLKTKFTKTTSSTTTTEPSKINNIIENPNIVSSMDMDESMQQSNTNEINTSNPSLQSQSNIINGYTIYEHFDEKADYPVYSDEYPMLPQDCPGEIFGQIKELRKSILKTSWTIHQLNNKQTHHLKTFNPPNKSTIKRFINSRKEFQTQLTTEMSQYWHILNMATNEPIISDPYIQEFVQKAL